MILLDTKIFDASSTIDVLNRIGCSYKVLKNMIYANTTFIEFSKYYLAKKYCGGMYEW